MKDGFFRKQEKENRLYQVSSLQEVNVFNYNDSQCLSNNSTTILEKKISSSSLSACKMKSQKIISLYTPSITEERRTILKSGTKKIHQEKMFSRKSFTVHSSTQQAAFILTYKVFFWVVSVVWSYTILLSNAFFFLDVFFPPKGSSINNPLPWTTSNFFSKCLL